MLIVGRLLIDPSRPPALGWLIVADGRIADMGHGPPPMRAGFDGPTVGDSQLLVTPGFIDAHMHLPQIESIGCDGLELLPWLERVIFPAEATWHDRATVARHVDLALRRMARAGTRGAAAFASPIAAAMPVMLDAIAHSEVPQRMRLAVGQALMDRAAPESLLHEPVWRPAAGAALPDGVELSVNPRFAISCSDAALAAAAALTRALPDPLIHTHLAESAPECRRVAELFPGAASYTDVYDHHGLLGPRTLLAHAVHLTPAEWRTIAERRCVVVHCPQANLFLRSGLFDLGAAQEHGVPVALGSDIAAGCDLAMPRVARTMIEMAKVRAMTVDPAAPIPAPVEAWHLITEGNADALGWRDSGRLAVGARADMLRLRVPFELDDPFLIARLLYGWEDHWLQP